MTTFKTLMLAGFTALTLGTGDAMAQEVPSMPTVDFWHATESATHHAAIAGDNQVQAGSSDVSGVRNSGPSVFDYGTLANPG